MNINDGLKTLGHVQAVIEYKSGEIETLEFPNTVLTAGRQALAAGLAHEIGDQFNFYVTRMLFGSNGTSGGATKYVNASRSGLFGATAASKPVIATVDPNITTQVIFTSVLAYDDAVSVVLNEMALKMANDNLYSMVTFPDLTKTSQMQITWNWRLSFV